MWTRFFPIIRKVREIVKARSLGLPRCIQAEFGFVGPSDPSHRLMDPALAGGAMLDIGIYLVQLATMTFGSRMPSQMSSTAILTPSGVDQEGALSLSWKNSGSASLLFTLRATTPENSVIMFEKGFLRIHGPAHSPERMTLYKAAGERGKFEEEEFNFPLPKLEEGLTVNYPSSEGLMYQVQAAEKCIQEGRLECPESW